MAGTLTAFWLPAICQFFVPFAQGLKLAIFGILFNLFELWTTLRQVAHLSCLAAHLNRAGSGSCPSV